MTKSGVEEWDLWVAPSFFGLALVLFLSPFHAVSLALDSSSSPALSPFLFLLIVNDFCAGVQERVNDETWVQGEKIFVITAITVYYCKLYFILYM